MSSGLLGYTDRLSVRPGQSIGLRLSSSSAETFQLRLHRVTGCRWTLGGPEPQLAPVDHPSCQGRHTCRHQPIPAGSYGIADAPPMVAGQAFSFGLWVQSTAKEPTYQSVFSFAGDGAALSLGLDDMRRPVVIQRGQAVLALDRGLTRGKWVVLACTVAADTVTIALFEPGTEAITATAPLGDVVGTPQRILFGAQMDVDVATACFDGRLADPVMASVDVHTLGSGLLAGPLGTARLGSRLLANWDFSKAMTTQDIVDIGPSRCNGVLINRPARAVTGPLWNGTVFDWRQRLDHYSAIHFHSDDLDDCDWDDTVRLEIPEDWRAGLYVADVENDDGRDLIPFVVRAPSGRTSALAVLLPTFTYLSYGNARPAMRGPDFGVTRYPDEETLDAYRALGKSQYDLHDDRSPAMFSSPRRPLLTFRFGVRPWGLPVDAALLGFLEHLNLDYDVVTDGDLHDEGYRALHPYRCVLTGNHPEYHSAEMLDGLQAFTQRGGRLVYLGGNGFYWRVSVCPDVGTIEVRRAEDGTRAWIAVPGEAHHAMDGGYGGLWRRLGRPPNALVDVGFAAQGDFDVSGHYRVHGGACDTSGGFLLDGVQGDRFGDYGWLGGGAAGQEIDRADPSLGTSPDTVVLASSTEHTPAMMRTIEEMLSTVPPFDDPKARADMTFRAVDGGGAVFSVGSMTWIASLDHADYNNDVARITANAIHRFLDHEPFDEGGGCG